MNRTAWKFLVERAQEAVAAAEAGERDTLRVSPRLIVEANAELERLQAVNAALLEAVRALMEMAEHNGSQFGEDLEAMELGNAVLALAEKECAG